MGESKLSSISKADNEKDMGDFWDTHDFTEYDTDAPDIAFEMPAIVCIEPDLLLALKRQAQQRGVALETLVNLWLQQKLEEETHAVTA